MNQFVNKEGQRVPEIEFKTLESGDIQAIRFSELFEGRTVAVFSLPGAFTPTCSSSHLPRYEELYPAFKANGVDEILCISVNDAFVMQAWGVEQGAKQVRLIPDGNAEFTQAMGMGLKKTELGFGVRSWRYSMLVKDGIIEKMFIEPDLPGDPFEVSDADTMLDYINPQANKPQAITVLAKAGCIYCQKVKEALQTQDLGYEEIVVDKKTLRSMTGKATYPQVFIEGNLIGGHEGLVKFLNS